MHMRRIRSRAHGRFAALMALALIALASGMSAFRQTPAANGGLQDQSRTDITPSALAQIDALIAEKASRTPAQRKIDSQLLYAIKMRRGEPIAAGVQALETGVSYTAERVTDEPRVVVDVTAEFTDGL